MGIISLIEAFQFAKIINGNYKTTNNETNNTKEGIIVPTIEIENIGNRHEPIVALENKVYPKTYYNHTQGNVKVDETPKKVKAQELNVVGWTLINEQ